MSETSEGGEDAEVRDLLEGRDRLLRLRAQRQGSSGKSPGAGRSRAIEEETRSAAFAVVQAAMSREEVQEMVRKKREEYAAKFAAGEVTAPVFSRIKRSKTAARACKKYVPVNGDTELVAMDPDMDAEDTAAWSDDTANDDNFVPISPPNYKWSTKDSSILEAVLQNTGVYTRTGATPARHWTDREYYIYARASGEHNHALTDELWDYYAEDRTIHDPALLSTVADMRSAGSSSKGILAWLRKKSGKKTKLKDVHNIFQELKHSAKGDTSDAERTESILQEFANQLDGNTARIFVDKTRDVAVAVVFQTEGMRRLFSAFPEVVMVDTTHDTNANAYKLFSFVVHDCFGKGQYVQHALVERETKDILRLVVNVFKDNNPAYSNVKVVMTDKAFHEKDVLAEVFKQARQLLCQFHVQQWFAKQVGRLMRGNDAEWTPSRPAEQSDSYLPHSGHEDVPVRLWFCTDNDAAVPLCESSPPCAGSATVLNDILTGGYSYDTAVQAMKNFNIVMRALSLLASSTKRAVACWPDIGDVTREQLEFMAFEPLQDRKETVKVKVKALNLRLAVVGNEAIDGFRLLSFRHQQWLSTTAIITAMKALAVKYGSVGVVSPSFMEAREPDRKRIVANAYNAFSPVKRDIIGALNFGQAHWVSYHVDMRTSTCRLFDPLQGHKNYIKLRTTLKEVVEPLLPMNAELKFFQITSCLQQDSDNCGLWRLVMLELALANDRWNKALYKVVPYLRLRYLDMCTSYIEERRGDSPQENL
ncbi:hypothetical protein PF004_g4928 [Phytophthora fragariae]|uniref:ZSWIM1/3 RNaseH-like domain-containing protein n=1 Tax=Phytophthora fragariae TaxID=53985 RepID=A0A6G0PH44_9STRA|nr:hypothetical protein PF004_g4928 [Phytophthora fragariae]